MNTKVNEGKLISGREALIALANGEEVEYTNSCTPSWHNLSLSGISINEILDPKFNKFRLKPRTITINGIEVPECGKDYKYGNAMYILNSLEIGEYCMVVLDKADDVPAYWWRTEDEIKQVVAALRKVFGVTA